MQVNRIEVFGFKSFMDRLLLPIESGITGVVGPNGCGKSNVVDAIRWVLGESRAKSLRGGTLEDVIFNGTDNLRPLGLAEVSICLKAQDENFFADLVSPSLEAELFADGIVEEVEEEEENANELDQQKDIEQTLEVKQKPHLRVVENDSESHNKLLEDKSLEAKTDTGVTPESARLLNRMAWLGSAREIQVTRRLYRSGESEFFINRVPCRLKDIKELFRAVGLGARAYTIVAQGEVGRIVTAKGDERRAILEEAAGVQGFREKINVAERRLKDTAVNTSRLDDIIREVERQVGSLKRQAARAQNRQQLKERIAELEAKLFVDDYIELLIKQDKVLKELEEHQGTDENALAELEKFKAIEEKMRNELMELDVEGDTLRRKVDAIREELNTRERAKQGVQSKISNLRAFILSTENSLVNITQRQNMLNQRIEQSKSRISELALQEAALNEQLKELEGNDKQALQLKREEQQNAQKAYDEKRNEHHRVKEELIRVQVQLKSSRDQMHQLLVSSGAIAKERRTDNVQVFVDYLKVEPKYARALQAILKEYAAYLLVEDPHKSGRDYVAELKAGSKKVIPGFLSKVLNSLKSDSQVDSSVIDASVENSKIQKLLSELDPEQKLKALALCVNVQQEVQEILTPLLKNIYVVDDLSFALNFFEKHRQTGNVEKDQILRDISIVTLTGEIITYYSFRPFADHSGLIELRSRIDLLESQEKEILQRVNLSEVSLKELEESRNKTQEQVRLAQQAFDQRQRDLRQKESELARVKGSVQAEVRAQGNIESDINTTKSESQNLNQRLAQYQEQKSGLEVELKSLEREDDSELQSEAEKLHAQYKGLDQARGEKRKALSSAVTELDNIRRKIDRARQIAADLRIRSEKIAFEIQHLLEKVESEYGDELRQVVLSNREQREHFITNEKRLEYKEEVLKIKARIVREGEVDSESIVRLAEEELRLADLQKQRKDLKEASDNLEQTIARLREVSTKRFLETYKAVKENFSLLIPRLFGGGKGELELSDENNPLDAELNIAVRPPGKKLKSLELLSGGEKALCATALIFAMFLERPSPLCILDEVDAPLDDANVGRFLDVVREMSKKTQFLMITHNKQSMGVADNLIGVTMQQPGASTVLQVSLQEAIKHVA
jgi:chromosome segregation protein